MGKAPKRHTADFKFRVVLESIQKNAVAEVARQYGVHPNQLTMWRKELLDYGAQVFERSPFVLSARSTTLPCPPTSV